MEVVVAVGAVVVFAGVVAVAGIRLGMLLAPRLDRLTAPADEDALRVADGADAPADDGAHERANDRADVHH